MKKHKELVKALKSFCDTIDEKESNSKMMQRHHL
jgi:hypothetical protein